MPERTINGVFTKNRRAAETLKVLRSANVQAADISIVTDIDEFRTCSTEFAGQLDKLALTFAVCLSSIGALTFFYMACQSSPVHNSSLIPELIMATISGAVAGAYLGMMAGTVIHFDQPQFAMPISQGQLDKGKVLLSVIVRNNTEEEKIQALMQEHGAAKIFESAIQPEAILCPARDSKNSGAGTSVALAARALLAKINTPTFALESEVAS